MTTAHEKTSPRTTGALSRLRRPAALGAASAAAAALVGAAPEHVQDAAAVELYEEWGTYPRLPSAHCWA